MNDFRAEMETLGSAEEFLDFFGVPYEEEVVRVNRLHILQRFHQYLARAPEPLSRDQVGERLGRAYQDFVRSDARTEKVFKVFRQGEPQVAFVPLTSLTRRNP